MTVSGPVLALDTSGPFCAVALLSPDGAWRRAEQMQRGQAERLLPLAGEVLREAGLTWADLARIGVAIGPGNFTGIRIGVAAARGLALATGVAAVGVGTLAALAHGLPRPAAAALSAPQGGLFLQIFEVDGDRPPKHLEAEAWRHATLPTGATVIGWEAPALAARCGGTVVPTPAYTVEATAQIAAAAPAPAERPAPLYLRPPDAKPVATPGLAL